MIADATPMIADEADVEWMRAMIDAVQHLDAESLFGFIGGHRRSSAFPKTFDRITLSRDNLAPPMSERA